MRPNHRLSNTRGPSERQCELFVKLRAEGVSFDRMAVLVSSDLQDAEVTWSATTLRKLEKRLGLPRRVPRNGPQGRTPISERQLDLMRDAFARGLDNDEVSALVSTDLEPGEYPRSPNVMSKWRRQMAPVPRRVGHSSIGSLPQVDINRLFHANSFEDDPRAARPALYRRLTQPSALVLRSSTLALCAEVA